jgi:hypothetical protein
MMTTDQQRHEQLLLQRTETNSTKLTGYFTQGKTANPSHTCVQKNCKQQLKQPCTSPTDDNHTQHASSLGHDLLRAQPSFEWVTDFAIACTTDDSFPSVTVAVTISAEAPVLSWIVAER